MDKLPDRLPLVIGTTGHRDLRDQDLPQLRDAVATVIDGLKRDYLDGDTATPIIILSSLAEGADQLVAAVAMEHGASLIAPLPMPAEEYRRDFEPGLKPDAAAQFDRLLSRAIAAPVTPFVDGNSLEAVRSSETNRALQYRAAGIFIARHCHVLIALWDGDSTNRATGGTAEVVEFKRRGIPAGLAGSVRSSLDGSEIGPVVHICTPRDKPAGAPGAVQVRPWGCEIRGGDPNFIEWVRRALAAFILAMSHTWHDDRPIGLPPDQLREFDAWDIFGAVTKLTRRFNREAARLARAPDGAMRMDASLGVLFEDPEVSACLVEARDRARLWAPRWCGLYQFADALAQQRQTQFKRDWRILFSLGLFALGCFGAASHIFHSDPILQAILLFAFVAIFALVFVLFFRARHFEHQERFLDYRALAEALRVAVFWKLVGIGTGPDRPKLGGFFGSAAEAYPIKQPNELAWVKISLRTLELLDFVDGPTGAECRLDQSGHEWIRRLWVNGQRQYFLRKGPQHQSTSQFFESWSLLLLGLSVATAGTVAYLHMSNVASFDCQHWFWRNVFSPSWCQTAAATWVIAHWHDLLILTIGILPGAAAVIAGYAEKLAFDAQARQYDRMRMLFQRAHELLPETIDATSEPFVQALYAELGVEAMKESAEWTAIYRQRPIRPPQ